MTRRPGRPCKLSDAEVAAAAVMWFAGAPVKTIMARFNISHRTLYNAFGRVSAQNSEVLAQQDDSQPSESSPQIAGSR